MRIGNIYRGLILSLGLWSCGDRDEQLFKKRDTGDSGVTFENKLSPTDDFNIIDYLYFYNGGGVSIGDINSDGLPDLYFSGNQVSNKLYLNKGNLTFEDITTSAGVAGSSTWKTGSVMGDVNGDGLLDIYVCAVVGLKNLNGHNELFINNGNNTFTERSAEFGLNFESYSSSAAFLDFDKDGDLDIYLLNHAVHTEASFGHADLRKVRTYESGGKLLRNDGAKFTDVSESAGIYGGINGYNLGVAISDFNNDDYPDIFVGNDFHEDDYFYINNRNGTFTEQAKSALSAMSKFSMGCDAADINHDGFSDLITLDMLPDDELVLKRSVDEENKSIQKIRVEKYGYHYQFPRNMLHVNLGNGTFGEMALMGNVAATDWSWSALFSDFDQDGNQDLFVSNGIPQRPNDLDYIKYVSSKEVVKTIGATKLVDQKALALMPDGIVRNYIFQGNGSFVFQDRSSTWLPNEKTCSTASAFGDLDNDGDLDLVMNNVDGPAAIYVNQTNTSANYLKIHLMYIPANRYGIGARVESYHNGIMQMKEMYTARGFQASSEPIIHFGYGKSEKADSIKVIWPDGRISRLDNVRTNQKIQVDIENAKTSQRQVQPIAARTLFEAVPPEDIGLDFVHVEDRYSDFDRVKLLPYQQSDKGPATAVGDIDNDGKPDIFFGGSKHIPSRIYRQTDSGFAPLVIAEIARDSIKEDVDAVIDDFNKDGKADVFIATGGADFFNESRPLLDSYYKSAGEVFTTVEIPAYFENASCVRAFDFDKDGDIDLFVGNESVSKNFGGMPKSYLLLNERGDLKPVQQDLFEKLGMVTDAVWDDYNKDGYVDLIVVGEWMQPLFLKNTGGTFEKENIVDDPLGGLWQSISSFDIDQDGDSDFVLGNWGLNSKFKASQKFPMKMYYHDFDQNGDSETIVAIEKNGKYYPLDGFDLMASQVPALRKKYQSYHAFAGKTVNEVFADFQFDKAVVFQVDELASGYLKNNKGKFTFVPFPMAQQVAPVLAQLKYDFDADGRDEILLGGNYFGVQPFHGRYASFTGALVKNETTITDGIPLGLDFFGESIRHFNVLGLNGHKYLLVTVNNGKVQLYKIKAQ